jgi:hypothetical protein
MSQIPLKIRRVASSKTIIMPSGRIQIPPSPQTKNAPNWGAFFVSADGGTRAVVPVMLLPVRNHQQARAWRLRRHAARPPSPPRARSCLIVLVVTTRLPQHGRMPRRIRSFRQRPSPTPCPTTSLPRCRSFYSSRRANTTGGTQAMGERILRHRVSSPAAIDDRAE